MHEENRLFGIDIDLTLGAAHDELRKPTVLQ